MLDSMLINIANMERPAAEPHEHHRVGAERSDQVGLFTAAREQHVPTRRSEPLVFVSQFQSIGPEVPSRVLLHRIRS